MEVLVGATFSIEVPSSPPYARDRPALQPQDDARVLPVGSAGGSSGSAAAGISFFQKELGGRLVGSGPGVVAAAVVQQPPPDDSSESSSSIGAAGDSEDEGEEEGDAVVSSQLGDLQKTEPKLSTGFGSLDSLEDALPIKRGLSNHYSGKSKSFANLSEVGAMKDLKKSENPFNKRRRVLIAAKWSRKSSFYTWSNPMSMPLLPVNEDERDPDQDPEEEDEHGTPSSSSSSDEKERDRSRHFQKKLNDNKFRNFKSRSCFSLADLQEEHE